MSDTKGNIRAKKLGNTGITENILKRIADARGGHILAIVELKADMVHEKVDGDDRLVDFLIDTLEPVVDGQLDGRIVEHVRTLQSALFRNRKLAENGPELPIDGSDGPEPTVEQVLGEGRALTDEDDQGPKLWDGSDDEPTPDDASYDPHQFDPGNLDPDTDPALVRCVTCNQGKGAAVHQEVPAMT